jgi:carbon-monoxide dehydrogenase small subunit
MPKDKMRLVINGERLEIAAEPGKSLLAFLREDLHLTSVKSGCGQGDCGACVVVMDGLAVNSCLVMTGQAQDSQIITVEGLEKEGKLHSLQRHFVEKWAFQCGYCTPGMIMSGYGLLLKNSHPTEDEIREAVSGNLCRCTNYKNIVEAVQTAADEFWFDGEEPEINHVEE